MSHQPKIMTNNCTVENTGAVEMYEIHRRDARKAEDHCIKSESAARMKLEAAPVRATAAAMTTSPRLNDISVWSPPIVRALSRRASICE